MSPSKPSFVTLPGEPPLHVTLRRTARARRLSLRVCGQGGAITLSMPHHAPDHEALAFLHDRAQWLRSALRRVPQRQPVVAGASLPVEGQSLTITAAPVIAPRIAGDCLLVPQTDHVRKTPARIAAFLKDLARIRCMAASEHYAAQLGQRFTAMTLRDTKSRWGSCTSDKRLMYSWRLIMAPPEVLQYVAAHEVAHLEHMDHSAAFWACVAQLMPDYASHRDWLRQHGASLQSYQFSKFGPAESG